MESNPESMVVDFSKMTVLEIKKFLVERGVSVNGYHKPSLIEIASSVQKMGLPNLANMLRNDSREETADGKLIIHDMKIENPFKMRVFVNNFIDSPPFGLYDIFNHLICHATNFDKQGLAAYKSFDDYRLFEDGYVESLLTTTLKSEGLHVYLGKVRPAMKSKTDDGKNFYELYFILEGKGVNRGSVLKAKCMCKGGRDGGCKHISAAMYSLEDLLNTRGSDSATSGSCSWIKRPTSSTQPCEVRKLVIEKGKLPSHRNRKRKHTYAQEIDLDIRATRDRHPPHRKNLIKFIKTLQPIEENDEPETEPPVILPLLEKVYSYTDQSTAKSTADESTCDSTNSTSILIEKLRKSITDNPDIVDSPNRLCASLVFTDEEIKKVNDTTLEQWQCKEWYIQKTGFITASKCKQVYTRQETIEKNIGKNIDVSSLVNNILEPKIPSRKPQISKKQEPQNAREWGLLHEESARSAYFRVERHKHYKIRLEPKGLLISNKKPFVGASLDNIRRCRCSTNCPPVVVEYKCPWKHRDLDPKEAFLTQEIGGLKKDQTDLLSTSSQYFYQVQLQMFVANLMQCDFVVWTRKGIHTVQVPFNKGFFQQVCGKLAKFWKTNILPLLVSRLSEEIKLPLGMSI
jgi:hypothetical protein